MQQEFQPGDVVRLKSGGPKMTVSKVDDDGSLRCKWFDGSTLCEETFPAAELVKTKVGPVGPILIR
jgi:uncharacterized protein YodC (DUF2158 family)